MRRHRIETVILILLLAAAAACRRAVLPRPGQNVRLITIDTLRADPLGCYVALRAQTPHLHRTPRAGAWCEQVVAKSPGTGRAGDGLERLRAELARLPSATAPDLADAVALLEALRDRIQTRRRRP